MSEKIEPIVWRDGRLLLLDQRRIPGRVEYVEYTAWRGVRQAIADMVVRGAPAIGVTAAYALVLAGRELAGKPDRRGGFCDVCEELGRARPTAVNLTWAIERMRTVADETPDDRLEEALLAEARRIHEEDVETNRAIGRHGADLVKFDARILHICNTGALATAGYGTALGVVRAAHEKGKRPHVWVLETRPRLQGMRLTAWELEREGIPYTILTDGMAAALMRAGGADLALAGADRIAANGDTANKVGTYSLAVLAQVHGIPFYVAAPMSTVDLTVPDGDRIPIERRAEEEVLEVGGVRLAPEGATAYNPAFDVTPAALISAIITEAGVLNPPYDQALQRAAAKRGS